MKPRSSRRCSSRSRSYLPCRSSRAIRTMSSSTIRFSTPMIQRNVPETPAPDVRPVVGERRDARLHGARRDRQGRSEREDDGRVAEREEEADAERALALREHLPRRVVDRRDVVGVERVPEPEGVGEHAEPGERRIVGRVVDEEPPARDVQAEDRRRETAEAEPLGPGQRLSQAAGSHDSQPIRRAPPTGSDRSEPNTRR